MIGGDFKRMDYYRNEHGVLFNGDCLDVMQKIPSKSIDCIICDLPYG